MRIFAIVIVLMPTLCLAQANQIDCTPLDPRVSLSKATETKVGASVQTLYKIAQAGGQVDLKAKEEVKNLPPDPSGKNEIQARWIYLFCEMLRTSKDMPEGKKWDVLNILQRAAGVAGPLGNQKRNDETPMAAESKTKSEIQAQPKRLGAPARGKQEAANSTTSMIKPESPTGPATPQQLPLIQNAPGGINVGPGATAPNAKVNNFGPLPANLTFKEDVVSPLSADGNGEKIMKVRIKTDRAIPGAIIGVIFSGPVEPDRTGAAVLGSISQTGVGGISKDHVLLPNAIAVHVNIPAAFTPVHELVVPVRSKVDARVLEVGVLTQ